MAFIFLAYFTLYNGLQFHWEHLDLRLPATRTERINFCCFKPLGLWSFVTAALRHTQRCVLLKGNSSSCTLKICV